MVVIACIPPVNIPLIRVIAMDFPLPVLVECAMIELDKRLSSFFLHKFDPLP